jgi:hypothetical protein
MKRTKGLLSNSAFVLVVFFSRAQTNTREIITIIVKRDMLQYDGKSFRTVKKAIGYSQM